MASFDSVISGASEKFGLGDKAGTMLAALLALVTNDKTGGFSGFIDKFKDVGLGDTANSWITSGDNAEISGEQLESALGMDTISSISQNVGMNNAETTAALAYMTPKVVDNLTPEGEIPASAGLLETIGKYAMGGAVAGGVSGFAAGDNVIGNDSANAATAGFVGGNNNVGAFGDGNNDDGDDGGSILKWLLPLIALAILMAVGFKMCGGDRTVIAPTEGDYAAEEKVENEGKTDVPATTTTTAEAVDSSFKIEAKDGKYVVTGVVTDEATKNRIMEKLNAELGEGNVNFDGLKIDANAKDFGANWWDNFGKLLPNLKDWKTGTLAFVGNRVTEVEGLSDAAKAQLKTLYADGWILPASIAGAEGTAKQANEEAERQLESAKTVDEVVNALNGSIINFASGSAVIPESEMDLVKKAAEVLKKVTLDKEIQIAGHTDSDGDDAMNQKLSQERADSVRKALVDLGVDAGKLTTKGYGETNPKVPNTSPDNKFANRRIEYKAAGSGESPTATIKTETMTTDTNTNAGKKE